MTQVPTDGRSLDGVTEESRTPRFLEVAGFLALLMASATCLLSLILGSSEPSEVWFIVILVSATAILVVAGRWLLRNDRRGAALFAACLLPCCVPLAWAWREDVVLVVITGFGIALAIVLVVRCLHSRSMADRNGGLGE